MKTVAILAAAGGGVRLGGTRGKLWAEVAHKPLVWHSLRCVESAGEIDGIILMAPASDVDELRDALPGWGFSKVIDTLAGGERRQDTVRIGLEALPRECGLVVIHDAARPMASVDLFARTIEAARQTGAATPAIAPIDTIVQLEGSGSFKYLERTALRRIQTPQAFKVELIREAHSRASSSGFSGTDDCSLVLGMGYPVELVDGEEGNFKITYEADIVRLQSVLEVESQR